MKGNSGFLLCARRLNSVGGKSHDRLGVTLTAWRESVKTSYSRVAHFPDNIRKRIIRT